MLVLLAIGACEDGQKTIVQELASDSLHCVDVYAAQIRQLGRNVQVNVALSEANFHFFRCAQFRQLFNGLTAVEIIDIVIVKFNAVGVLVGVTSV